MFNELINRVTLVDNLTKAGLLSPEHSAKLKNHALQTIFNNGQGTNVPASENVSKNIQQQSSQMKLNPRYSNLLANENIKLFLEKYFKNPDNDFINNFSTLLDTLKDEAVKNYENTKNHEANLKNSNQNAKNKLISQTQTQENLPNDAEKVFTREEVDKMSLDEFQKNEAQIMKQLEKGLF